MGSFVPAETCRFSLVDRIFVRIGGHDNMAKGKSTFFVEMEETANIIEYGTKKSLAIIDELGQGTSTLDGIAIAFAFLKYMLTHLQCRCLFTTHYHILLEFLRPYEGIKKCLMSS